MILSLWLLLGVSLRAAPTLSLFGKRETFLSLHEHPLGSAHPSSFLTGVCVSKWVRWLLSPKMPFPGFLLWWPQQAMGSPPWAAIPTLQPALVCGEDGAGVSRCHSPNSSLQPQRPSREASILAPLRQGPHSKEHDIKRPDVSQRGVRSKQEGEISGNWIPQEGATLIHCPEKPWEASGHNGLLAIKCSP